METRPGSWQAIWIVIRPVYKTTSSYVQDSARKERRPKGRDSISLEKKEALLEHYASIASKALDYLMPEERHHLYRMLRLGVIVRLDAKLEVSGVFGESISLRDRELVSIGKRWSTKFALER